MESTPPDPKSPNMHTGRIFYGWWVIAVITPLYALASGIYFSGFSFYFLPVTRELGISRTSMSLALGLARLAGGIQAPLAGYLIDKVGPRRMIAASGALAAVGFILLAFTHNYITFVLVYVGLMAIGISGGFDQGIIAVANRWFVARRARAMSIVFVGISLGAAFLAPGIGLIVVHWGWRVAAVCSGITLLVLLVPAFLVIRDLPEQMGLLPDGAPSPQADKSKVSAVDAHSGAQGSAEVNLSAAQGLRTPAFWFLTSAMGLRIGATTGFLAHFVPIMVWKGQTETTAALLIGIYGLTAIPLRLFMGWAGDRWPKQKTISLGMLTGVAGLLILILGSGHLWQLIIFVALFAASDSTLVVAFALFGELFGRKAFATLLGVMTMVYSFVSAATPVSAGVIFDATASYFGALVLFTILLVLAGMLFWTIPRPKSPFPPAAAGVNTDDTAAARTRIGD